MKKKLIYPNYQETIISNNKEIKDKSNSSGNNNISENKEIKDKPNISGNNNLSRFYNTKNK